jgi:hypothetical protein
VNGQKQQKSTAWRYPLGGSAVNEALYLAESGNADEFIEVPVSWGQGNFK